MFLKESLHIVGATLAFREGDLIRYCLDDLLKHCNEVIVVLDNSDKKTEDIVREYRKNNKDRFFMYFSEISADPKLETKTGALKSRLNAKQRKIREKVLEHVRELSYIKKIDLLYFLDADECFTDYVEDDIRKFISSDKKIMAIRPVTIYDSFEIARMRTLIPHGKIYKYIKELTAIGYRGRGFYKPYEREDVYRSLYTLIHYPLLTKEHRDFRKHYVGDRSDNSNKYLLYKLNCDARKLSPIQLNELIHKRDSMCTIKQYEKKRIFDRC